MCVCVWGGGGGGRGLTDIVLSQTNLSEVFQLLHVIVLKN